MSAAFVLPVPVDCAVAWSRGWIDDVDLMTGPHPTGAALYLCTLPDLDAWRRVLPVLCREVAVGASCLVLRTGTPVVARHVTKWGAQARYQDASGKWRYWAGPEIVRPYFGRIAQKAAAASPVTTSR